MVKRKTNMAALRTASVMLAATLTVACAQTGGWLDGVRSSGGPADEPLVLGAPDANEYLRELAVLATGDPATQAEIFADAESRATLTPDPSTSLRFALTLATPGHSEWDPERAQSMLRELLTQTALMTPAEISLAQIYLQTVEAQIVLYAEARRLRQNSSRQTQTEEQAINQRIANVEAENRRLRRALQEAENKLEAITTIEQSIRDQDN